MTKTFTQRPDFTGEYTIKEEKIPFIPSTEPSSRVIQNILNFSKNLEIKTSRFLPPMELIKS